jgi:sugar/nucleoside kinase (ribokinase family)
MKLFGIGRFCMDDYYVIEGEGARVDSNKMALRPEGTHLGGSVPRTLEAAALAGVDTELFDAQVNARSMVLFHPEGSLHSVMSVNEDIEENLSLEQQLLAVSKELERLRPDCVAADLRYPELASEAFSWAKMQDNLCFLDPGTSTWKRILRAGKLDEPVVMDVLSKVRVICSSEDFFELFVDGDLKSLFLLSTFESLELAVCTLDGGAVAVATPEQVKVISRAENIVIRNSFGVGDVFKGWLVAGLMGAGLMEGIGSEKASIGTSIDKALVAVKHAIAAATISITDARLVKPLPALEEVQEMANNLELIVEDWTSPSISYAEEK